MDTKTNNETRVVWMAFEKPIRLPIGLSIGSPITLVISNPSDGFRVSLNPPVILMV